MPTHEPRVQSLSAFLIIMTLAGCGTNNRTGDKSGDSRKSVPTANIPPNAGLLEARGSFTCRGKPIHPGLVNQMMPWISDNRPTTVSVDILASVNTNQYPQDQVRVRAGWTECDLEGEPSAAGVKPSCGYQHCGGLANGVQVLRVYRCGGGSGIFTYLMFVRFETEIGLDWELKPYPRLLMKLVAVYPLGDRDDGEIKVLSDRVVIGKSQYRDKKVELKLD